MTCFLVFGKYWGAVWCVGFLREMYVYYELIIYLIYCYCHMFYLQIIDCQLLNMLFLDKQLLGVGVKTS
ncbi:MAG: hypothetical protein JWO03_2099 [Bacteroidetes bacterium]|nr:hypothetical protein [Bacteroidota bacterium]